MGRRSNIDNRDSYGFSLLELIMVLAIASILAGIGIPGFIHIQKEWALWSSMRMVEISLQWGRMHAIAANSPMMFEIREAGRKFVWLDPETGDAFESTERALRSGTHIASAPGSLLRFYPRGNAVPGGTYRIEGATGAYSVIVTPGGRIRTQKN